MAGDTGRTKESKSDVRPMNGAEFLESLRDDREVWIYGQRVKDVTQHPAFRNSARMLARLYDALHAPKSKDIMTTETDTGNGGYTHRFFRVERKPEELVATRDAIAHWARLAWGWLGRSPDYKASFLGTLGANADFYAPHQESARKWYKRAQEQVLFINHALLNPPVDKNRPPHEVKDVFVNVEKETDGGVVVSGAKVVGTGSALTHANFLGFGGLVPLDVPELAIFAMVPMTSPGVKLLCRPSYEMAASVVGSPFDYPLSSRLDENDAILMFDKVFIPWEDVFIYRDPERANNFYAHSGFMNRFTLQACTRLAVKLDFLSGLLAEAIEASGSWGGSFSRTQMGELLNWRDVFWGLSDALARTPQPWRDGTILPSQDHAAAYRFMSQFAYPRIRQIILQTVPTGMVYTGSHAADLANPELRPYIDRFLRGSMGYDAEHRVKVFKLLWDAVGSEFGGRHELYECFYLGNYELVRNLTLEQWTNGGRLNELKAFAESCMKEYDVHGWTVPDLINPSDVSHYFKQGLFRKGPAVQ